MIGNTLVASLFAAPFIYCISRLAGFKNRHRLSWIILGILAPLPTSYILHGFSGSSVISGIELLSSVPIFVLLALIPPISTGNETDAYHAVSSGRDRAAWTLLSFFSILFVLGFCLHLYKNPPAPAINNAWFYGHAILKMIGYSALFALFGLSVARIGKRSPLSKTAILFQVFSVSTLYAGTVLGAVWAKGALGSYWCWDPKETWSAILLYLSVGVCTYLIRPTPGPKTTLALSTIQVVVVCFVVFITPRVLPGLWGVAGTLPF